MCREAKVFKNWKMTYLSGLSLLVSFTLAHLGKIMNVDLAWGAILLSGLPMIYVALGALVKHHGIHKITLPLLGVVGMVWALYFHHVYMAGIIAFGVAVVTYFYGAEE